MRKLPALAAACLFLLAAFAPAAAHASVGQILRDCQLHGKLTRHYSQQDYRNALAQLQGDQSEYSDCESTIRAAQAADARASAANHQSHSSGGGGHSATTGGTHSGGGSNGPSSGPRAVANHGASKADQNAIHRAAKQSDAVPLPSGGTISPTTASASGGSGLHAMPVPLRIVLILLAAGALTGVGLGLRRRVLDRRSDT